MFSLLQTQCSVVEGGNVSITIVKTGLSSLSNRVQLSTESRTATGKVQQCTDVNCLPSPLPPLSLCPTLLTAGVDFTSLSMVEVIFAATDLKKELEVVVNDDIILEASETFGVVLSVPSGQQGLVGVASGADTAEVTIEDNDGMYATHLVVVVIFFVIIVRFTNLL